MSKKITTIFLLIFLSVALFSHPNSIYAKGTLLLLQQEGTITFDKDGKPISFSGEGGYWSNFYYDNKGNLTKYESVEFTMDSFPMQYHGSSCEIILRDPQKIVVIERDGKILTYDNTIHSIIQSTIKIDEGATERIYPHTDNDLYIPTFTYSIKDTSIATLLDDGLITGKKAGVTDLIITEVNSGIKKTVKLHVLNGASSEPTATIKNKNIYYNGTEQIDFSSFVNLKKLGNKVTLSVDNDYVIMLSTYDNSNGIHFYFSWPIEINMKPIKEIKIQARQLGTTTLKAKTDAGKTYKWNIYNTKKIDVTELPLNTSKSCYNLFKYDFSVKNYKKGTWSSKNTNIISVDSKGNYKAKKIGSTTLIYKLNGVKYEIPVKIRKQTTAQMDKKHATPLNANLKQIKKDVLYWYSKEFNDGDYDSFALKDLTGDGIPELILHGSLHVYSIEIPQYFIKTYVKNPSANRYTVHDICFGDKISVLQSGNGAQFGSSVEYDESFSSLYYWKVNKHGNEAKKIPYKYDKFSMDENKYYKYTPSYDESKSNIKEYNKYYKKWISNGTLIKTTIPNTAKNRKKYLY